MQHESLKNTFNYARDLQFDVLKIEIGIFLFIMQFLYVLLFCAIIRYFGIVSNLLIIILILHWLVILGIAFNVWNHQQKFKSVDYKATLRVTKLLHHLLNQKIDSSTYVITANRQRSIWQNIMRFASFVVIDKNGATLFIANTINVDSRRSIEFLNDVSLDLAKYLKLHNTAYQRLILDVNRFGFNHVEEYEAKKLYT